MIVEFLSSNNRFSAVSYNSDKVSSGKAELLCVKNFQSLSVLLRPRAADFKAYLRMIGSLNPKVKNKQLHVALSVEKHSSSKEILCHLAQRWLEKMGYKDNPYLIYFHKDTLNNHVHVVSVRVDKKRRAVPSRYEKLRGTIALHELIGFDAVGQAKADAHKALSYGFSSIDQFLTLLKSLGYSGYIKNSAVNLVRHSRTLYSIDLNLVYNRIHGYQSEPRAIIALQQLFALFLKIVGGEPVRHPSFWHSYLRKNYKSDLGSLLSDKANIVIIYHSRGKEVDRFTVINHNTKRVHEGDEIIDFQMLTRRLEHPEAYLKDEVIHFYKDDDTQSRFWRQKFVENKESTNVEPKSSWRRR